MIRLAELPPPRQDTFDAPISRTMTVSQVERLSDDLRAPPVRLAAEDLLGYLVVGVCADGTGHISTLLNCDHVFAGDDSSEHNYRYPLNAQTAHPRAKDADTSPTNNVVHATRPVEVVNSLNDMDEWREAVAPVTGRKYYYNRKTRESAWR